MLVLGLFGAAAGSASIKHLGTVLIQLELRYHAIRWVDADLDSAAIYL